MGFSLVSQSGQLIFSPGDNGTMHFWDWRTGYNFQRSQASVQPGSLDSEAGIFAMTFDLSSSRLITCEADKTIKIYKEDDAAVSIKIIIIFWKNEICYFYFWTLMDGTGLWTFKTTV